MTSRPRVIAIGASALLLGGMAVFYAVARPHWFAAHAYSAPTMPVDCSTDDAPALNAWFLKVPDGSTLRFAPQACYRIDETLRLESRHRLVIDGNGATFKQVVQGAYDRRAWAIVGGDHITMTRITVVGANPAPGAGGVYDPKREGQSAFYVGGADHVSIISDAARATYGDFVQIINNNGCPSCPTKRWATNIRVERCMFSGAGRQGISISAGSDVLIDHNSITDVRRTVFDIEPAKNSPAWGAQRITISNNHIGSARLLWLSAGGRGADVSGIDIEHNMSSGVTGTPLIDVETPSGEGFRHDITVRDNTWQTVAGSPAPAFKFINVRNVVISGNRATFPKDRKMIAIGVADTTSIDITGNSFPGSAQMLATITPQPKTSKPRKRTPSPSPSPTA